MSKARKHGVLIALAIGVTAVAAATGVVGLRSNNDRAGAASAPTTSTTDAPAASTTEAPASTTTAPAPVVAACPGKCTGHIDIDVDGDAWVDHVGYFFGAALPVVRVVLADGEPFETTVPSDGVFAAGTAWLGAANVDGVPGAEIFVVDAIGAHGRAGKIVRWNGAGIGVVRSAGEPFMFDIDGYANGDAGFRCDGSTLITSRVQFSGENEDEPGPWTGTATTYRWHGMELQPAGTEALTYTGAAGMDAPQGVNDIYGAHCAGLPRVEAEFPMS